MESHRRAASAWADGRFDAQVVAVDAPARRGTRRVECDEHLRPDLELEALAALRPVFREGGTVTAGNSSGMNWGRRPLLEHRSQSA